MVCVVCVIAMPNVRVFRDRIIQSEKVICRKCRTLLDQLPVELVFAIAGIFLDERADTMSSLKRQPRDAFVSK